MICSCYEGVLVWLCHRRLILKHMFSAQKCFRMGLNTRQSLDQRQRRLSESSVLRGISWMISMSTLLFRSWSKIKSTDTLRSVCVSSTLMVTKRRDSSCVPASVDDRTCGRCRHSKDICKPNLVHRSFLSVRPSSKRKVGSTSLNP